MEVAVDRTRRCTAGLEAVLEDVIGAELEPLRAVLGTDIDVQATVGTRQLYAVLAQVARHRGIGDVLRGVRAVAGRNRQVGQGRRRDATLLPDVLRHAGRLRAVGQGRAANRSAGRDPDNSADGGIGDDIQRIANLLGAEEVTFKVREVGDAELGVGIVGPGAVDLALEADDLANGIGQVVVLASAAFDVAPAQVLRELQAGAAELGLVGREICRRTDGRHFLRRQQRVVAAGRNWGVGERAARSVLRLVLIAGVHGLRVGLHVIIHVVVQERTSRPALGLALEVAQRPVVVGVGSAIPVAETAIGQIDSIVQQRDLVSGGSHSGQTEQLEAAAGAGRGAAAERWRGQVRGAAVQSATGVVKLIADRGELFR